jgi:hypothetical protein
MGVFFVLIYTRITFPMRKCTYLLFMITSMAVSLSMQSSPARAGIVYIESTDGDLSGNSMSPSSLGTLMLGVNSVSASTIPAPLDRDFFTLTLPANTRLDSIILRSYSNVGSSQSFFAVIEGSSLASVNDPGLLLGAALIGNAAGATVGNDLLDDLANRNGIGGTPQFSGPLLAGASDRALTFWHQETAGVTTSAFEFNVSAVPEPSALTLLAVSAGGLVFRQRCRLVKQAPPLSV